MDFIFILRRRDQMVEDGLETQDLVTDLGVQAIGVAEPDYEAAVLGARYLKDRFISLDLADDAGRLGEIWRG